MTSYIFHYLQSCIHIEQTLQNQSITCKGDKVKSTLTS